MEEKNILIADEDQRMIVRLKDSLIPLGFVVNSALNGAIALQKILNDPPDLILMEVDLKIISGGKVAEILQANPRMVDIPILFFSREQQSVEAFNKLKDTFILKPFNYDEVLSKILKYFKHSEKTPNAAHIEKETSGHLSQISLVDLLQVFSMNKKSGKLIIASQEGTGTIYIKNGAVINTKINKIYGEKAFYRLLAWREGRFNFIPIDFRPGEIEGIAKISKTTDNLLMEGLRQLDEWQRIKGNFPDFDTSVKLKLDPKSMTDVKPVTQEIFIMLEFYSDIRSIVDNCSFCDFEVLKTLSVLLQKGVLEEMPHTEKRESASFLLSPDHLVRIKKRLMGAKSYRLNKRFGKVLVLGGDHAILTKVIQTFLLLKEFSLQKENFFDQNDAGNNSRASMPAASDINSADFLGILGVLKLTEGMNIMFYSLPLFDSFKPLWTAFSQDIIDVLLLIPEKDGENRNNIINAYDFFKNNLKKIVKPVLITDSPLSDEEFTEIKRTYGINEIYKYNTTDKEGIKNFFVNLLIETL